MGYVEQLVNAKLSSLTADEAAEFFGVKKQTIEKWVTGSPIPVSAAEKVLPRDFESRVYTDQLQQASWEGKKVAILLPWYKQTNPVTSFCVAGLLDRVKMSCILNFNDAFISHSRNFLATQFLQTGIEWSFSLDDDMIVPWGNGPWFNKMSGFNLPEQFAGQNILNRLLSHNKKVIGALYFGRNAEGKPLYAEGWANPMEAAKARQAPFDAISPTRWVATGALLVHRQVFLDIEKSYPALARKGEKPGQWYSPSEHDLVGAATQALQVLGDKTSTDAAKVIEALRILDNGKKLAEHNSILGMGEDVQFCTRAAAVGHTPHVDFGCLAGHIGYACYGPKNTFAK